MTPRPKHTLKIVFFDDIFFFWFILGSLVGAPSIVNLLNSTLIDYQFSSIIHEILLRYNSLLELVNILFEPMGKYTIIYINQIFDYNISIQNGWENLFILLSIGVTSIYRYLYYITFHNSGHIKSRIFFYSMLLITLPATAFSSIVMTSIPLESSTWLKSVILILPLSVNLFIFFSTGYILYCIQIIFNNFEEKTMNKSMLILFPISTVILIASLHLYLSFINWLIIIALGVVNLEISAIIYWIFIISCGSIVSMILSYKSIEIFHSKISNENLIEIISAFRAGVTVMGAFVGAAILFFLDFIL